MPMTQRNVPQRVDGQILAAPGAQRRSKRVSRCYPQLRSEWQHTAPAEDFFEDEAALGSATRDPGNRMHVADRGISRHRRSQPRGYQTSLSALFGAKALSLSRPDDPTPERSHVPTGDDGSKGRSAANLMEIR